MEQINIAKDRAEQVLDKLQNRAKSWLESDAKLAQKTRTIVEQGNTRTQAMRTRLNQTISDLRAKQSVVESKVDASLKKIVQRVADATKDESNAVSKQIHIISKKIADLSKKSDVPA